MPAWLFAPGHGEIDAEGAFVGVRAGHVSSHGVVRRAQRRRVVNVTSRDAAREVKVVGRVPRNAFFTTEVWVHPNGKVAYLGTGLGGDACTRSTSAIPRRRPSSTRSWRTRARERRDDDAGRQVPRVHARGRERSQERHRHLLDSRIRAHPKPIAEFTEGVTAGVHSAFIYKQEKFGTHIYLTNDGTGALHIIDINDPYKPKRSRAMEDGASRCGPLAARHRRARTACSTRATGTTGSSMLDVGNGMKGGSPSKPKLVSQLQVRPERHVPHVERRAAPASSAARTRRGATRTTSSSPTKCFRRAA